MGKNRVLQKRRKQCSLDHQRGKLSLIEFEMRMACGPMGPSLSLDSIYGSTFFLATSFNCFHVIIGTLFLIIERWISSFYKQESHHAYSSIQETYRGTWSKKFLSKDPLCTLGCIGCVSTNHALIYRDMDRLDLKMFKLHTREEDAFICFIDLQEPPIDASTNHLLQLCTRILLYGFQGTCPHSCQWIQPDMFIRYT